MTKICTKCGQEKALDQFHRHSGCKCGRNSVCKTCSYAANTKYRKAHREQFREYTRKQRQRDPEGTRQRNRASAARHPRRILAQQLKKFDITLEQYDTLFGAQSGVCAICGKPQANGWRLDVDHDHETGIVRGLLCRKCNQTLGMVDDDKGRLLEAALYLERHGK